MYNVSYNLYLCGVDMSQSGEKKSDWSDYILVNVVEEIVRKKTRELIKTIDMCQCEKCCLDACAIALNSLHQIYVTTHRGALLTQIDTVSVSYQAELICEIVKALMLVKNAPRH